MTELYSDEYSWTQYILQSIIYPLLPRFNKSSINFAIHHGISRELVTPKKFESDFKTSEFKGKKCPLIAFDPKIADKETEITFFYFHGGAYVMNSNPFHFDFIVKVMKETGRPCSLLFADYPLAPDVAHEALFDSIYNMYLENVKSRPNQKIVIMGDSAGGGISLILAQRIAAAKKNGRFLVNTSYLLYLST